MLRYPFLLRDPPHEGIEVRKRSREQGKGMGRDRRKGQGDKMGVRRHAQGVRKLWGESREKPCKGWGCLLSFAVLTVNPSSSFPQASMTKNRKRCGEKQNKHRHISRWGSGDQKSEMQSPLKPHLPSPASDGFYSRDRSQLRSVNCDRIHRAREAGGVTDRQTAPLSSPFVLQSTVIDEGPA